MADRTVLPVPGIEMHVSAERHQFVEDATHDPTVVAARKVGAADAFAEQRIAGDQQFLVFVVEADMARGMARVSIISIAVSPKRTSFLPCRSMSIVGTESTLKP